MSFREETIFSPNAESLITTTGTRTIDSSKSFEQQTAPKLNFSRRTMKEDIESKELSKGKKPFDQSQLS